jgi:hypothetical protein
MGSMIPQCSHITRKRGIYTYRRRLPRPHRGEVALSLGTTKFRPAEALASILDEAFVAFFETCEMSGFDVQAVLRTYLRDKIERLRRKHFETPYGEPVHVRQIDGHPNAIAADFAALDHQIKQMKMDIRRRDIRSVDTIADRLAGDAAVSQLERTELALGVLQAEIQLLEQSKRWLVEGLVDSVYRRLNAPTPLSRSGRERPRSLAMDRRLHALSRSCPRCCLGSSVS